MFRKFFQRKFNKKTGLTTDQIIKNIIKKELHFHFSKSWWHWWQKINKKKTKAELYFNIRNSEYLTDEQKDLLVEKAWHAVHHHEEILIMTCHEERYQKANKKKVIEHFVFLLREILK